jgi:hypothetical protein
MSTNITKWRSELKLNMGASCFIYVTLIGPTTCVTARSKLHLHELLYYLCHGRSFVLVFLEASHCQHAYLIKALQITMRLSFTIRKNDILVVHLPSIAVLLAGLDKFHGEAIVIVMSIPCHLPRDELEEYHTEAVNITLLCVKRPVLVYTGSM